MSERLFEKLQNLEIDGKTAFHMPGHKRNVDGIPFLGALGGKLDITEIEGFDDLHHANGILKQSMDKAAKVFGAKESIFLVNGSTCGLISAVRACQKISKNNTLIAARNCHKSVFNAAEIFNLNMKFIVPEVISPLGICASISPFGVEELLKENRGATVLITSPSYDGIISDIQKIAEICHKYSSLLIVDEAHGAHLGFSEFFPKSALDFGADIVVQSVHKTLTALTQGSILHINSEKVPREALVRELRIFESSSPSYLIMASLDETVGLLESQGDELFSAWNDGLEKFYEKARKLRKLKVYTGNDFNDGLVFEFDRSKVLISCENISITGFELMDVLRGNYNIELEMASLSYATALTGILTKKEDLDKLAEALMEIDENAKLSNERKPLFSYKNPEIIYSLNQMSFMETKLVELEKAANMVCGETVYAYPPGIPLVLAGELLSPEILENLMDLSKLKLVLKSESGKLPNFIKATEYIEKS